MKVSEEYRVLLGKVQKEIKYLREENVTDDPLRCKALGALYTMVEYCEAQIKYFEEMED